MHQQDANTGRVENTRLVPSALKLGNQEMTETFSLPSSLQLQDPERPGERTIAQACVMDSKPLRGQETEVTRSCFTVLIMNSSSLPY